VIRPLQELGLADDEAPTHRGTTSAEQRLVRLAAALTRERAKPSAPGNLIEATAALQDLACQIDAAWGATFARLIAKVPATITVAPDGPYPANEPARVARLAWRRLADTTATRALPLRPIAAEATLRRQPPGRWIQRRQRHEPRARRSGQP
jgi:hypothetical protein